MKNWLIENRYSLLTSVLLYIFFQGLHSFGGKDGQFVAWILLYIGLLIFSNTLPEWRVLKPILIIIYIPVLVLHLAFPFMQTFMVSIMLLVFSFGLLAVILIYFPEYPFHLDVTFAAKLYILLISGSVVLTLWGDQAISYFNTVFNSSRAEEKEKVHLDFTMSLVNRNKIKFLIYIGFFIYLIIYSFAVLSDINLFTTANVDKAVFNAFISYIAFERVLTNIGLMNIDRKSFLTKLLNTWKL